MILGRGIVVLGMELGRKCGDLFFWVDELMEIATLMRL